MSSQSPSGQTVTLALNGEVPLDLFAEAMKQLRALVDALGKEVRPDTLIEWYVEQLQAGNVLTTFRGESPQPDAIAAVVSAFLTVGQALAQRRPVPYSRRVTRPATELIGILNGKVTSIRFETQEDDATVLAIPMAGENASVPVRGYGAVEGRIQTLTSRNALRFTLYDAVYDRAVSCYLEEGRQDLLRAAWDRRALVEGWVSRDPETGRPIAIRHVQQITLIDDIVPGALIRAARAIAPLQHGVPPAVDAIRELRDG